jgi:uncharacterized membrane protein/protein-disulfide isomerase
MNRTLVPDQEATRPGAAWPWWRRALTGLSALALILSSYLSWHSLTGASMIGCSGGSSCDDVLNSRWSSIGGILPISGLAAGAYLAMLLASFYIGPTTEMAVRRLAWRAMLLLAGAIAGSAVWFIAVQKWFIGSFCPYCMATHITGVLLAVLILWQAPKQFDSSTARRVIGNAPAIGMSVLGLVLACLMAVSQIYFKTPAIYRGGESRNTSSTIDPHNAPMVGSPDAPYVVTLLFDYKCAHCRKVHSMLEEAIRRSDGKLAIVLCPTPLNPRCNPYVPQEVDEFKDSCELAKIALAVWVAKREAFPVFDQWMFSIESGDHWQPRTVDGATAKAIELVGQTKFNAALTDPWIDRYLQNTIRLYGTTTGGGNNAVPKFIFGSHWVIPQPNDVDDLVSILRDNLAVPLQ